MVYTERAGYARVQVTKKLPRGARWSHTIFIRKLPTLRDRQFIYRISNALMSVLLELRSYLEGFMPLSWIALGVCVKSVRESL